MSKEIKPEALQKIFNIKSNYNFLESLVFWILSKYQDPLYLSNITILLPNRRSCREIKKIFLKQSGSEALLLPKIKAIGDVASNEFGDELFLNISNDESSDPSVFYSMKPISELKYKLLLIEEIKKWNQKTSFFGKNISTVQFASIAKNLEEFLNEAEKENLNLDELDIIDESDLAEHKQQILQFLKYFGSNWQNILEKNNLTSASKYRNQTIDLYNKSLKNSGSKYPIIAAGSTGTIKSTANLLKTIREIENGYLIFCGLDHNLSDDDWNLIPESHPQFGLRKIINFIGSDRNQIQDLEFEQFKQNGEQVSKLLYYANLPASKTNNWLKITDLNHEAISHITKIESKNNFDEARTIALIIKEALENKETNIALISNNKNLARILKNQLQKWEITIDDSKNNILSGSGLVNYLILLLELFENNFRAVNFLAILKHPLTKAGFTQDQFDKNLKIFELQILRQISSGQGFDYLKNKILESKQTELINWFDKIINILNPLQKLYQLDNNDLHQLILTHLKCAEELSTDKNNQLFLYQEEAVEELIEFLNEINEIKKFNLETENYSKIFSYLTSNYSFRSNKEFHPRIHILSTIEARLINYDLTIISGLNEGEFPTITSDNWLGKKMRKDFGLPSDERKIGIAAYDFCNYLGNKKVIITRSYNENNSPTFKSRFLYKLEAVLTAAKLNQYFTNNSYYQKILELTNSSDRERINRPNPKPNLALRPTKLSVTDIGKWIRDPYFIYAKRILNLRALNKIEQEPSFAEFGNFVHEVLEKFINDYQKITPEDRLKTLLNEYGKRIFKKYFGNEEDQLLWWPKFENIANWFVKNEEQLQKNIKKSFTEIKAEMVFSGITINTIIDRVNIDDEKQVTILDYKTGLLPQDKEIKAGLEPQLSLEALILSKGKIKNYSDLEGTVSLGQIKNLEYWKLSGKDQNEIKAKKDFEELITAANDGIINLITIFSDENMGYISCPSEENYKKNDYQYLARIEEWK